MRRPPPGGSLGTTPAVAPPKGRSAGGPSTREQGALGQFFASLVAYFEVRTVTPHEIDLVWPTYQNGWLRPQVEAKLASLHPTCADHYLLRRWVATSMDLLTAVAEGTFDPGPGWPAMEARLLRALAYFVKDNDAIPDHLPNGLDDDLREFAELAEQAEGLFRRFRHGTRPRR